MRGELVREADLGAQGADESDEQDFQRQTNRWRRAPGEFFPCCVQATHDGPCHGNISRVASLNRHHASEGGQGAAIVSLRGRLVQSRPRPARQAGPVWRPARPAMGPWSNFPSLPSGRNWRGVNCAAFPPPQFAQGSPADLGPRGIFVLTSEGARAAYARGLMTKRLRVLLVDDDDSVRRALARAIRRAGFDVQAFRSVEALLALGLPEHDACLVLDVNLPGTDGIAFKQSLAAGSRDLPTIFITALEPAKVSEALTALAPVAVLYKPFDNDDLIAAIERAHG